MIALLPAYLTKAYVRGHLRTLADGRAIQVNPYHTKTAAASREDTRTRDIFADIPPAENQHRPRIHPARTTTPRKAVVPFKSVYPQLFDDKPLASEQNVHYNKDIKGRNPAPATEGKKMESSNPRTIAEMVQALDAKDDTGKPVHPSMYRIVLSDEIKDAKALIRAMEERPRPALADKLAAKKAWLAEAEAAMERETETDHSYMASVERQERLDRDRAQIPVTAPEKPAKPATSTPRLMAAADFLETEIRREGYWDDDDDEDVAVAKQSIKALRETPRTDLDGAVWASILSVLGVKNATYIANMLTENEGKKFSATPKAGRIYLSVPYADKDKAKATADKAGTRIRFDGDKKKWYWEGEGDLAGVLARWK